MVVVEDNDQQCLAALICFAEFSETTVTWVQVATSWFFIQHLYALVIQNLHRIFKLS